MGYTATAIIGSYGISRLTPEGKLKKVIAVLCLASAFLMLLLYFAGGVVSFAAIRMVQTGVIAAVIPLVMANFASQVGGTGIGFLNSARFAGNGVGPLLATTVLAGSNLLTLYLLIAVAIGALGQLAVPAQSAAALWPVLLAGLVGAGVPTVTYITGIRRLGAPRAAILANFEPVVGVALAALLLAERPAPLQLLGGALIIGSGVVLQLRPRAEAAEHEAVVEPEELDEAAPSG